jgi:nicotinamide-nucleotide amidase
MYMLGVREERLNKYGPVSEETARDMVLGALEKSGADAAVSVTGLAGPGGNGTVGTMWIATALRSGGANAVLAEEFHFSGGRNRVRQQAARKALEQIIKQLRKH